MFEAVMMASTGLQNQQRRIDNIADNIANVNTVGFKGARLDFKDALYTAGFGPAVTPEGNQQKGHGVMVAQITKQFLPGSMVTTESMLDFAIEGDGFFELRDPFGNQLYTMSGNFYMSNSENGMIVVNSSGMPVMNADGQEIHIPEGTTKINVSQQGEIEFIHGEEVSYDRFGLYNFQNKNGLSSMGGSNYRETEASGEKSDAVSARLTQGSLESSNVDMATEMVRLIRANRAFSLASSALRTADDMEGIANNLRR